MRISSKWLFIVALAVAVPGLTLACSVPVFRYALEHWLPDPYRVTVFHDDNFGDADKELADWLKQQRTAGANVDVRLVNVNDTEQLTPIDKARLQHEGDQPLPRMVVQLPGSSSARLGIGEMAITSAAWQREEVEKLIRSPARTELANRLAQGEVVWVFLDSGNDKADEPLFATLKEEIAKQQKTLKLPEIDEEDLAELGTKPEDLKIAFSALRVNRADPAEKWFAEMLLSVESDLREDEVVDQPMVFPVFGRGRALYALVGNGINADTIHRAAVFLTGACQCTVKSENPGVDLLLPIRWDDFVEKSKPKETPIELTGLGGPSTGNAEPTKSKRYETPSNRSRPTQASDSKLPALPKDVEPELPTYSVLLPVGVLFGLAILVGLITAVMLRRSHTG